MNMARVRPGLLTIALLVGSALSFQARVADAIIIIDNGTVQLGINDEGQLNVPGPPSSQGTTAVGLRYVPTNAESTAPGCLCEGWGVANADEATGTFSGWANQNEGGAFNLELQEAVRTNSTGHSAPGSTGSAFRSVVTTSNGRLRITHDYHPSSSPNLYEVDVTIENIGETTVGELRYRRMMDWDVEPTPFNEWVRIVVGDAANLLRATNNGFATGNPLADPGDIGSGVLVPGSEEYFNGPLDQGALFDFTFGALPAGAKRSFKIYYGAAASEAEALAAVSAVGAQVFSFGYPNNGSGGPATDGPNVFIFAFGGVGGTAVACADPEAPCVRNPRKAPEPQNYTTEWKGEEITSPGAGVVIDWTGLVQLNVHKEGTTEIIGPCVPGPPPLGSAPFETDQIVSLPDGTVLTPAQAKRATKRLLNDRKKLLKAQKTQRTVRLAAEPSDGTDLTVKIFQFDPAALEIARDAGCAGVRINYTYTIVGQGIGGLLVPPVTGGDFVDWLVEEEEEEP